MKKKTTQLVSTLAFLWMGLSTATSEPIYAELAGEFDETHSPNVLVSGLVVLGILSGEPVSGNQLEQLSINSSNLSQGMHEICLTVSSKDGVYSAKNTYNISSTQTNTGVAATVRLPYEQSRYLKELAKYQDGELTFLATEGDCKNTSNKSYVVSAHPSQPNQAIRLHINSLGATDVFASINTETLNCTPLSTGSNTNYDYECHIPAHYITNNLAIEIQRERFSRPMPSVTIRVN